LNRHILSLIIITPLFNLDPALSLFFSLPDDGVRRFYVMKTVSLLAVRSEKERKNALQEVRLLQVLNHPNVVAYKVRHTRQDRTALAGHREREGQEREGRREC
jgi:hypothetical protein